MGLLLRKQTRGRAENQTRDEHSPSSWRNPDCGVPWIIVFFIFSTSLNITTFGASLYLGLFYDCPWTQPCGVSVGQSLMCGGDLLANELNSLWEACSWRGDWLETVSVVEVSCKGHNCLREGALCIRNRLCLNKNSKALFQSSDTWDSLLLWHNVACVAGQSPGWEPHLISQRKKMD